MLQPKCKTSSNKLIFSNMNLSGGIQFNNKNTNLKKLLYEIKRKKGISKDESFLQQ